MLIQCTKKLFDVLKIKPTATSDESPLFSWHANLIIVNRRKAVVLVNDSNRYIIALHGMKAKDFKNINELIINGIRETFLAECIKAEIVEQFINHAPEFVYTKTKNQSMVAKMNKTCEMVYMYADDLQSDAVNQSRVNIKSSNYLVKDGNGDYIYPNETLYQDLANFSEIAIFSCRAVELKITLSLTSQKVWRSVIVPLHITFKQLHMVLQIVFNWNDYHLHDFHIFDGNKPFVNLVCSDDAFEYPNDIPMMMETDIRLSDYIPKYPRIKYTYDFGDNWQHYIEVQNMIDNYEQNYPVCVLGEGNAPPEDVGGEGGYDQFLEAIADPKHPDYADMIKWSSMQGYKNFDIKYVNRRLVNSLKN